MGDILKPKPVKLFIAITYKEVGYYSKAIQLLKNRFGSVDQTYTYDFTPFTDYYSNEMGYPLKKCLLGFNSLISKEKIHALKKFSNEIELLFAEQNDYPIKRNVNIDPGYLTEAKVVLLTTKNFSHRIYLNEGIFAEITLSYRKDSFIPNNWTYPDYNSDKVIQFFNALRVDYRNQLYK